MSQAFFKEGYQMNGKYRYDSLSKDQHLFVRDLDLGFFDAKSFWVEKFKVFVEPTDNKIQKYFLKEGDEFIICDEFGNELQDH